MATNVFNFGPILDQVSSGVAVLQMEMQALQKQAAALAAAQGQLSQQLAMMEQKMADDFTALNQAVTDLQSEVGAVATQLDTLFQDLQNGMQTNNQPAIDAATAAIQAQIQALQAAANRDMPPPPPAPGP